MALTIINSVTDFSSYNDTNADIIMVRDAERTSGNHFFWNTSTTTQNEGTSYDGATIPTPNTPGVWQMMYAGPISVKWFGALTTGPDATLAIQKAIDFAVSIEGAVYLPDGTYTLHDTIVIRNGLRAFFGPGKLYFYGPTCSGQGVIDVEGSFFTKPAVVNCRISVAEIDANSIAKFGIFLAVPISTMWCIT